LPFPLPSSFAVFLYSLGRQITGVLHDLAVRDLFFHIIPLLARRLPRVDDDDIFASEDVRVSPQIIFFFHHRLFSSPGRKPPHWDELVLYSRRPTERTQLYPHLSPSYCPPFGLLMYSGFHCCYLSSSYTARPPSPFQNW